MDQSLERVAVFLPFSPSCTLHIPGPLLGVVQDPGHRLGLVALWRSTPPACSLWVFPGRLKWPGQIVCLPPLDSGLLQGRSALAKFVIQMSPVLSQHSKFFLIPISRLLTSPRGQGLRSPKGVSQRQRLPRIFRRRDWGGVLNLKGHSKRENFIRRGFSPDSSRPLDSPRFELLWWCNRGGTEIQPCPPLRQTATPRNKAFSLCTWAPSTLQSMPPRCISLNRIFPCFPPKLWWLRGPGSSPPGLCVNWVTPRIEVLQVRHKSSYQTTPKESQR